MLSHTEGGVAAQWSWIEFVSEGAPMRETDEATMTHRVKVRTPKIGAVFFKTSVVLLSAYLQRPFDSTIRLLHSLQPCDVHNRVAG